jgi:hypothetical protein
MHTTGLAVLTLTVSVMAGRSASAEEARAVVERAITAAGGEARLTRLKAAEWTCQGTAHASTDLAFTDRCFAQWPEQYRAESTVEVHGQTFRRALILDSARGWIAHEGNSAGMNDAALTELRDKVHLLRVAATLLPLKEKGITLKPLDPVKIEDRPALGVSVSCAGRQDLRLYFDKEKGLLLKCERTVNDPFIGKVSEETFFSEYREADGVLVARKVSVKRDGKPFLDWTVTDFQVRAKLDRGLFVIP